MRRKAISPAMTFIIFLLSFVLVRAAALGMTPIWSVVGAGQQANLGYSVASAGDVNGDGLSDVVVGAPGLNALYVPVPHVGEVYVYLGSANGPSTTPAATIYRSEYENSGFGYSVAGAGDVNGDGYSDIIVGDLDYHGVGAAAIYFGSPGGTSTTPGWLVSGTQGLGSNGGSAGFGTVVAGAGDVNGDGFDDVLVADPQHDTRPRVDNGAVYLYLGGPGGPSTNPDWTFTGVKSASSLGYPLAGAGDVNGDGYADIVVSEPGFSTGSSALGRVLVFLGSPSGLRDKPDWTMSDASCCAFGSAVASAGDVNGDGYADVIIGQSQFKPDRFAPSTSAVGRAYVFLGSKNGLSKSADWIVTGTQTVTYFGGAAASAGDVNADGYADVMVGAPTYSDDQSAEGRVFVYLGSGAGLSTLPVWFADGDQAGAGFGSALASAGDVNGDGHSDIVIGALGYTGPAGPNAGRAVIYAGGD